MIQSELAEYFSGKRQRFTAPLHTPGTDFQQIGWDILQQIPCGETRTYKQQAIAINNPKAVRAVASANGKSGCWTWNLTPLLIQLPLK
ncbi:MAG: methylated-DNA--[protein]-cysteine S-methyltransferase [Pseudomonadales bacterium]|nr:methylated-DNA--[protein]-cysteine S-methyltransferase [Pseudomonadales bacterium]